MVNVYKFIWDSTKGKRLFLFLFFLATMVDDVILLFLTQHIYKFVVNSIVGGKFELEAGIFYIFIFCCLLNFGVLGLLLKSTFKFRSVNFIQKNIRNKLFSYAIQHSMDYFNNSFSGALSGKIRSVVDSSRYIFTLTLAFLNLIILFLAVLFVYFHINCLLALFFSFITSLYIFVVFKFRKSLICVSTKNAESKSKYFGLINDDFANISNIKMFNMDRNEINRVKKQNFDILRNTSKVLRAHAYVDLSNSVFSFLFIMATMGFSVYLLVYNKIELGDFLFIWSVTEIFKRFLFDGVYALTQIFENLGNIKNGINTIMKPIQIRNKNNAIKISNIKGRIVFKNVNFGYRADYD